MRNIIDALEHQGEFVSAYLLRQVKAAGLNDLDEADPKIKAINKSIKGVISKLKKAGILVSGYEEANSDTDVSIALFLVNKKEYFLTIDLAGKYWLSVVAKKLVYILESSKSLEKIISIVQDGLDASGVEPKKLKKPSKRPGFIVV